MTLVKVFTTLVVLVVACSGLPVTFDSTIGHVANHPDQISARHTAIEMKRSKDAAGQEDEIQRANQTPAFDAVISKWPPRATRDVEIEVTRIGKREETDWHTGGGRCGSPSIVYLSSGGGPPEFTEDATMVERKTNTRVTLRDVDTPWSKKLPPYDGKRDEENKKRNAAASALTEDSAGS